MQSPRQEVLSPHSAKWTAFFSGGTCIFYHGAAASVKQAAALGIEDCDTEYRRWYNKCKKSGTSSFFENRGQLLRRFGNEHDYGGDEYAVPMPTDGKIRALRRSLFRGSMLTKTAKRSTVSVLKRRTRPMEFSIRNVPPV